MLFQCGQHLALTVFRFAGSVTLFLCHVIIVSIPSIIAAVMPSHVMFAAAHVRCSAVIVRHHPAIRRTVTAHAVSSTAFTVITYTVTHLIQHGHIILALFIPVLCVFDILIHINQLKGGVQIARGEAFFCDIGYFIFNSCAQIFNISHHPTSLCYPCYHKICVCYGYSLRAGVLHCNI